MLYRHHFLHQEQFSNGHSNHPGPFDCNGQEGFNQRPYFFLYGFAGVGFILFYFLYHVLNPKVSFEHRIKRDMLFLMGCSLALYLIPLFSPGFQQKFFPAAIYFVVYDILR